MNHDNPHNEVRPDFAGEQYAAQRQVMNMGEDAAVQILGALWEVQHAQRIAEWDREQNDDGNGGQGRQGGGSDHGDNREQNEDGAQNQGPQGVGEGQANNNNGGGNAAATTDKKPFSKMPALRMGEGPANRHVFSASPKIVELLLKSKYVPLWFFCEEGL